MIKQLISDARQWVRYHTTHRYHIIKTGLPPDYYDEDVLILYACMTLLDRFIAWHGGEHELEKFTNQLRENPKTWGTDADGTSDQVIKQTEALAIWRWWKYQRPFDEASKEQLWNSLPPGKDEKYNEINALEEKMLDDEQEMLQRLIKIRPGLWE